MDRFALYELCVQSPRHVVGFLHAVHGNRPTILREDFCGTAAVSRRWVDEGIRRGEVFSAIAVDVDQTTLDWAKLKASDNPVIAAHIQFLRGDCTSAQAPAHDVGADIIFVGNFSIGYIYTRSELLSYLRDSRDRLSKANSGFGGGIFVCDLYGGASAFTLGGLHRRYSGPKGEQIHYNWLHEEADAQTCIVQNSISFRVIESDDAVIEFPREFVYRWRLWSIPELRDVMLEAGFSSAEVHVDCNIAPGEVPVSISDASSLMEDWIVLVVGRTE